MKKTVIFLAAAVAALSACQEWQPVFTGEYKAPASYEKVTLEPTHTLAELAAMYNQGNPLTFDWDSDVIVAGKVSSSDETGNFYKSLYIQDETGGMELKIGKTSLYGDYKPGQTIYVKLGGLTVGVYGYKALGTFNGKPSGGSGMVQIGYMYEYLPGEEPEYETSYMDATTIIDSHVFRGEVGEPVVPVVLDENDLPGRTATLKDCPYLGKMVTIKDLKYDGRIFTLVYVNSNKDHKASSNRIFLSDTDYGVTTWAMSKNKFLENLDKGLFNSVLIGNSGDYNYGTVYDNIETVRRTATAATVSQYFMKGNTEVVIRTSGYAKFADTEIPLEVLQGKQLVDVTGVLTLYQGGIQITVNSLDDITFHE